MDEHTSFLFIYLAVEDWNRPGTSADLTLYTPLSVADSSLRSPAAVSRAAVGPEE